MGLLDSPLGYIIYLAKWGPSKQFLCRHRVHQGYPLSLLLCVVVGDLLQSLVNDYACAGKLTPPLDILVQDYPII